MTSAPKQQHAECSFVCSAHTAAGDLCDSGPGPITASRRDGQRLKPLWFWLHRRVHLIFRSVVLYRSGGAPWFLRGRRRPRYGETREVSQRWPRLCKTCRPFFFCWCPGQNAVADSQCRSTYRHTDQAADMLVAASISPSISIHTSSFRSLGTSVQFLLLYGCGFGGDHHEARKICAKSRAQFQEMVRLAED